MTKLVLGHFLRKNFTLLVKLIPVVLFSAIAYSQVADQMRANNTVNEIPGIVWANLAFCTALVFHAGMLVSRHKNLETRVSKLEDQELRVHMEGMRQKLEAMDRRFETLHEDFKELKVYYESLVQLRETGR